MTPAPDIRNKTRNLMLLLVTLHVTVVLYALFIQQVKGKDLKSLGVRQGAQLQVITGRRGSILDRNGRKLALDVRQHSVYAVPSEMKNAGQTAALLSDPLNMSAVDIRKKTRLSSNFVWLKRLVDDESVARIKAMDLDGIGLLAENGRVYPNGESAAAILGIKGLDRGIEGSEYAFEEWLKGEPGEIYLKKDASGRTVPFSDHQRLAPKVGSDVYLSIDMTVQFFAEEALKKTIENNNAKAGSAIVLNPATGEIYAMAGYPTYDANRFKEYENVRYRNRPIWKVFEPGSVLKPLVVAMAVDAGVVDPFKDTFYCEKKILIDGRYIGEHDSNGLPARKSVTEIISKSYNTGMARIALVLKEKQLKKYLSKFNFGRKYDGLLLSGQEKGLLPQDRRWADISVATIGYGQGIGTTALQVAMGFAALANGGVLFEPQIVDRVVNSDGKEIYSFEPKPIRRVVSKETARIMKYMLHQVVEDGTGTSAKVPGYSVAGKTGTAKVPGPNGYVERQYISSFVGFAPVDNPQLLVMVVVELPWPRYYASETAAPAFKEIMTKSLWHFDIAPSENGVESIGY